MTSARLGEQILHDVREKLHKHILVPLERWHEEQHVSLGEFDRVREQIGRSVMEDVVHQTMYPVREQLHDAVRRSNSMWRRGR